jgi:hypothetical protein
MALNGDTLRGRRQPRASAAQPRCAMLSSPPFKHPAQRPSCQPSQRRWTAVTAGSSNTA